jgi:hypothetical protein
MDSETNDTYTVVGDTPIEDIVFSGPTFDEFMAEQEATRLAQQAAKESGLLKLVALGLTEEEARAVIGL